MSDAKAPAAPHGPAFTPTPLSQAIGQPVATPDLRPGIAVPAYLGAFRPG